MHGLAYTSTLQSRSFSNQNKKVNIGLPNPPLKDKADLTQKHPYTNSISESIWDYGNDEYWTSKNKIHEETILRNFFSDYESNFEDETKTIDDQALETDQTHEQATFPRIMKRKESEAGIISNPDNENQKKVKSNLDNGSQKKEKAE